MKKIQVSIYSLFFILLIGIGGGFYFGQAKNVQIVDNGEKIVIKKETGQPKNVDFSVFWDTWEIIEEKYVDRPTDYNEMVYGAISGLVDSLDDPYSVFMNPEESKEFMEDMEGSFEGIGAEIGIRKNILTIIAPLEGMPAEKAGLKAGDKIIKIDGETTIDITLTEAVRKIRGEKGTEVILTIMREETEALPAGRQESKEIKIIRGLIDVKSVEWEIKKIDETELAYLKIRRFSEDTFQELNKAAGEILSSSAKGIVLDLRNNPGGYLDVAVKVTSIFIDGKEVVVIEDFGNGDKKEYKSSGRAKLAHLPVAVLINQGSASASEILAGALRDIKKVKLVGEKTFGKGSVQELERLKDKSSVRLTVAKWLIPSGHCINEEGLKPDIEVEMTDEDIDNGIDKQLEEAMKVLK
jgi:carboxyl-terminal processing protease